MLLSVRGRDPGFGAFPAQRGLVFVPPTFQMSGAALGWDLSTCKLLPGVKEGKRWFFVCFFSLLELFSCSYFFLIQIS